MLNINNLSSIKEKQANLESARKVAQMQVLADRHNPERPSGFGYSLADRRTIAILELLLLLKKFGNHISCF